MFHFILLFEAKREIYEDDQIYVVDYSYEGIRHVPPYLLINQTDFLTNMMDFCSNSKISSYKF